LWFYDEAPDGSRPNQVAHYGTGTVSANGSQIVPDIDPASGKQYASSVLLRHSLAGVVKGTLFDFISKPPT
jgi:hypothetical protein